MNRLHVYTGEGKGKTTAAMGLALRSLGHGNRVLVAQFMKKGNSGELAALRTFENALIITAEPEKEYLKLYLSDSLLANLRENSFDHLSLVSDSAELSIDLDAVGPSIFSTDKAIWYYIFTAARQSNGQYRVSAEAQTSVTDIVEAGFYSGITLIRAGVLTPVILNGIY